jgi:transcriptional antiterminator RfaH
VSAFNPDQAKGGYQWFVVVTKVNQERVAKYQLGRQGIDVYLPMVPPPHGARVRNGIQPGPRPMIPRYLFICVDVTAPWGSIHSTVGVHDVIKRGSGETARPSPIPNRFVEEMQIREVNGLVILPHRTKAEAEAERARLAAAPKKGDKLRWSGPTADYDFIFERMLDEDRAVVLFKLLGVESRQIVSLPSD